MFKDPVYFAVIGLARTVFFAQGLKFTIKGWENVPKKSGAVVVTNHTGYMDFTYAGIPFRKYRRYVRFMAKKEIFDHPIAGPIMRSLKHIPVDRTDGTKSFEKACELLEKDELVGIFPESTISRSFEVKNLKSGAVRMAQRTGKPIVPVLIVGSQRVWTKGFPKRLGRTNTPIHMVVLPPWHPEGDPATATNELHEIMDRGVRQLWDEYAAAEGPLPTGAYWVPARLGGGAPTFEEAQAEDLKVEAERERVRHLRGDLAAFAEKLRESGRELSASARELSASARELGDQTKTQLRDATQTVSTGSARAREQAKEQTAAMKEQTVALMAQLRQSVEQMADDVVEGAKEGKDSLHAATDSIRTTFRETYGQIEQASAAGLEQTQQSLHRLIAQSKMIRDKLPQRVSKQVKVMPETFIFDYPATLVDDEGHISAETLAALRELGEDGATIIVLSDRTEAPELAELADVDFHVAQIPEQPTRLEVTDAVAVALKNQARDAEGAMLFAARESFADALQRVGTPVVTVDADWALLRTAEWVIDSAQRGGVATTLTLMRQQCQEHEATDSASDGE